MQVGTAAKAAAPISSAGPLRADRRRRTRPRSHLIALAAQRACNALARDVCRATPFSRRTQRGLGRVAGPTLEPRSQDVLAHRGRGSVAVALRESLVDLDVPAV